MGKKLSKNLNMKPSNWCTLGENNSELFLWCMQRIDKERKIWGCFPINDLHGERKKQNEQVREADVGGVWRVDQVCSNSVANAHFYQHLYDAL